ncbi:cobaltochelatase subunit CobN [Desulfobacula toluolica]|uniref:CobN: hydrogenobyrinic acid a,c-diamide cobaltochelatase n=1 Tax=Desulfobacula toluolica (strain DSM 7467 / Tol2) TaxID=651182 RepID=K0NTH1_DESTT|nr:cobaltochelatase subunit CobN [Desulfobacula toluolica]CCK82357.1 CobN: hydrogenobyrinic acid a,c-diamide cobaltochelatase [Desulfobacula toluolica Tol2]
MKSYTLAYYSATSMEISSLSQGIEQFIEAGKRVRVHAKTQTQLFDDSRIHSFVDRAVTADIIIITLHGGKESCPAFDPLIEALNSLKSENREKAWLHIQPMGGDEDAMELARKYSTGFGTPAWDEIHAYLKHGGAVNFKHLLFYLHDLLIGADGFDPIEFAPPLPLPLEGIYHPDFSHIPSFKEYDQKKIKPGRITIGLWFYQTYWVNNNLKFINALIRTAEKSGANIIPVFHLRYKDKLLGNRGADDIARQFFMKQGKPVIDVLINPMMFSMTLADPDYKDIYPNLNVPVIQAMTTLQPYESWKQGFQGMTTMEVSFAAAQPEFDGTLISVPVASREMDETDPLTGALIARYMPILDRVEQVVNLALNWARLSKKENQDKKVAIIFHHYPPRNDRIGCAAGLDSFESVKKLVDRLKQEGYRVEKTYEKGDTLSHEIIDGMTCDQRWLMPEQMYEKSVAHAERSDYLPWHDNLPKAIKEKQVADWGDMPGDLFVHKDELLFSGVKNGNLFITVQPPRGYLENIDKAYHDMYLSPPHHYLAQYRYIKHIFKADAVIHVGKHGSLEWLPGKALGLSRECYPDLSIMDLPNIYPYIINDPSEGTQAKRRSYACIIDHLTPVFTNADLYEDLSTVENHLKEYYDAVREDPGKVAVLKPMIWEAVVKADLDKDLKVTQETAFTDFDAFLEDLHAYLGDLGDTMINDGLHILGTVPEKERLIEFLVQLTRVANGSIPSLRESIVKVIGHDYDHLLENKGRVVDTEQGLTGSQLISKAHSLCLELVTRLLDSRDLNHQIPGMISDTLGRTSPDVEETLAYLADCLVPNIEKTPQEIMATLTALNGGFVLPGPSGAPTRGQADILPTGRNFYSVDPYKIPSLGAWEVGQSLAHALLARYQEETGNYPESVGIIVYGGSTMRSKGDDIAEIFYLLGVKPVWHKTNQTVLGLEIIPLRELGRPRIDVVPRISGFFRDSFPLLVKRIDEAVQMVAALDEPLESNLIRRHVSRDIKEYESRGLSQDQAFREATFRVFGCPPGTYGAGVSELVESKNWKTQEDLGNNYIRYSSHAYGEGSYGLQKPAVFRTLLSRMNVTVKNEDSREYDMMSCTDYYNYYGGLIVAGKTVTGKFPFSMVGDSSDPKRVKMRTTHEEAKHVLRSRLVNPKWLEGMMRHGYKGAGDISHMMDVALGWDATAEVMEDWMYERMANAYVLDEKMKEWMNAVNPYARQNILDKLLEAISRGMWQADSKMEATLKEEYLEIEGEIEGLTE